MKITGTVEQIFAHAVGLDQNGGLKNTIFAIDDEIYIMNYDHTVLLRFGLRKSEAVFPHPISFRANDYDSNEFTEENGKITFHSANGDFVRKKSCAAPDLKPEDAQTLFYKYWDPDKTFFDLADTILPLIDRELSHIEFSARKGEQIKIVQRNIYSGALIEIQKSGQGMFQDEIQNDFGPVAIKTGDMLALYMFQDVLKFAFPRNDQEDYVLIQSGNMNKRNMCGIIACCIYDEIIEIREARHGRKEQKVRRSQ